MGPSRWDRRRRKTASTATLRKVFRSPPPERRELGRGRKNQVRIGSGRIRDRFSQRRELEEFPVPIPFQEVIQVAEELG